MAERLGTSKETVRLPTLIVTLIEGGDPGIDRNAHGKAPFRGTGKRVPLRRQPKSKKNQGPPEAEKGGDKPDLFSPQNIWQHHSTAMS